MIWVITLFVAFVITSVAEQPEQELSDELFQEVLQEVERQNNWEPEQ